MFCKVGTDGHSFVGRLTHNYLERLSVHSLSLSHVANMNIFISSMEDFTSINAVYSSYFGVSPPARACVAVDLPAPLRLMLDCVAFSEQKASDRQALHVQGLSYWAPANIGPYSQAVLVRLVFLRPSTLKL